LKSGLVISRQRRKGTPKLPEEIQLERIEGDDVADALRYLVATRSRTVTQSKLRGL
jgi:hypothetical protein